MTNTDPFFSPEQIMKSWQFLVDSDGPFRQGMQFNQSNVETMLKIGSLWSNTLRACTGRQLQYCTESVEECITALRELSLAGGLEGYVKKQVILSQHTANKAQSNAQNVAQRWQEASTQSADLIAQQFTQSLTWFQGGKSSPERAAK